tara:strand:- start:207 stop:533 length:327 start_codon:yes stop_codon:yes gene_type:complete
MKITKTQLKQIIKEEIESVLSEGRYEEIDPDEFKSTLQGNMEELSQEELAAILQGEKIADPMNPATFQAPGTLIPLGKKNQFVYFKDFYGPVLRAPVGAQETETEAEV